MTFLNERINGCQDAPSRRSRLTLPTKDGGPILFEWKNNDRVLVDAGTFLPDLQFICAR
jgi:hypothetical protein